MRSLTRGEVLMLQSRRECLFFFNDTATTEIYTLSLHDALPILAYPPYVEPLTAEAKELPVHLGPGTVRAPFRLDRKSTRLNSSHANISYAVFCLKKKKMFSPSTQMFGLSTEESCIVVTTHIFRL